MKQLEPGFGEAPERLDAVDVRGHLHKLIRAMTHPKMPIRADIYQAAVPASSFRINHSRDTDSAPYNGLQGLFVTIRDDFRVHLPLPFEQAKDHRFAARPASTLAPDPPRAEVGFVQVHGSGQVHRHGAGSLQAVAQPQVEGVDRTHAQPQ